MMAKMFYTMEETMAALGRSEEDIKQFTREGRLREFRDGKRLMFKADQVDALKGGGMAESGAPLSLADTGIGSGIGSGVGSGVAGMTGTGIGTGIGSGIGSGVGTSMGTNSGTAGIRLAEDTGQSSGTGMTLKDDTALAADLGLSGSIGGVPSPGRPSGGGGIGTGLSGSVTGSRAGINVLGDDAEPHDPMAQTNISPGMGGTNFNLEGVGSGSGLLDLTRESDDTSLGAALLDEISPGSGGRRPAETSAGGAGFGELDTPRGGTRAAPIYVEAQDDLAPAFGGMALGGFVMLLVALVVLAAGTVGGQSDIAVKLHEYTLWAIFIGGLVLAIIFFAGGLLIGKAMKR